MNNKPTVSQVSLKKKGQTQANVDMRMQAKKQRKEVDKKVAQEIDKVKADYKEQIRKLKQDVDKLKKKNAKLAGDNATESDVTESQELIPSQGYTTLLIVNLVFAVVAIFWLGGVFSDFVSAEKTMDLSWYLLLACTVINITMLWVRSKKPE